MKCILLSRISTGQQNLEQQTKDLIKFAKSIGFKESDQIVIESIESAIKLSEEERQGLNRLKNCIETESIDCVICWEPSRLARQQKILYSIRDYLLEHKIQLYILNPYVKLLNDSRTQFDTTANIVFSLYSTLSENEMNLKGQRFKRAKEQLRQEGKKFGGSTLFGYIKNKDKYMEPHPLHSKIILFLFNYYLLNDVSLVETYKQASSKWPDLFPIMDYRKMQRKMHHWFETEVYATGNWCYPSIITKEIFDKVKDKMSNARCKPRYGSKKELLCRGKIYCGHCGKRLVGCFGTMNSYCCTTDKQHSLQVSIKAMDWLIWEEVSPIINISTSFYNNEQIVEINNKINERKNLIEQYNNLIKAIEAKKDKLLDVYMDNKITKEQFEKRMDALNNDQNIHSKQLMTMKNEINELTMLLSNSQCKTIDVQSITEFSVKQEYVRQYIDKMIVTKIDNRLFNIEFKYRIPVIGVRSIYTYDTNTIHRINEDGSIDLIWSRSRDC